jgi:biopolymer transport protein ExbD
MKRLSPLIRRGSETDLDTAMTPMIDVVFLLLVFFVWTASFQIVEQILPSEMSELIGSDSAENVEPPPPKDFDDIVVRIGWDGQTANWKINDQGLPSLAAVGQQLKTIAEIQVEATVILRPEPVVPLGNVIEAYDIAKLAGFEQISFAVNPQGP